jgi:hypothetical protein
MPHFIPAAAFPGPRPLEAAPLLPLLSLRSLLFRALRDSAAISRRYIVYPHSQSGWTGPEIGSSQKRRPSTACRLLFGGNCRACGLYNSYNPPPPFNGANAQTFAGYQATGDIHHAALSFPINRSGCSLQTSIPRFWRPPMSLQSRWWQAIGPHRPVYRPNADDVDDNADYWLGPSSLSPGGTDIRH